MRTKSLSMIFLQFALVHRKTVSHRQEHIASDLWAVTLVITIFCNIANKVAMSVQNVIPLERECRLFLFEKTPRHTDVQQPLVVIGGCISASAQMAVRTAPYLHIVGLFHRAADSTVVVNGIYPDVSVSRLWER